MVTSSIYFPQNQQNTKYRAHKFTKVQNLCKAVSQEPHLFLQDSFAKWSGTGVSCDSYGVYRAFTESIMGR